MHMANKINRLVELAVLHAPPKYLNSCDVIELVVLCLIG